jgi:hypothetical protein
MKVDGAHTNNRFQRRNFFPDALLVEQKTLKQKLSACDREMRSETPTLSQKR